jgi:hypothetical protein
MRHENEKKVNASDIYNGFNGITVLKKNIGHLLTGLGRIGN